MKFIFFFTFIIFSLNCFSYDCIGSKELTTYAIYLHGMDSEKQSEQELTNRMALAHISKALKIGIAIPRAKDKCPNDTKLRCWGWNFNEPKALDYALAESQNAKNECFPKAKSGGLVGFSNGGFVANQILKDCRKTDFNWLISIGAGGSFNKTQTTDLSKCGTLILMAGKKDKYNYEPIKELSVWLMGRGAHVTLIEYSGGHLLPEKELQQQLKKNLN